CETRSVVGSIFFSCPGSFPNLRDFRLCSGAAGRMSGGVGLRPRLDDLDFRGPKNFFEELLGSAPARPGKRSPSGAESAGQTRAEARTENAGRPAARMTRATPCLEKAPGREPGAPCATNRGKPHEEAWARRASLRRFIRLRMRSRLRLEMRST